MAKQEAEAKIAQLEAKLHEYEAGGTIPAVRLFLL